MPAPAIEIQELTKWFPPTPRFSSLLRGKLRGAGTLAVDHVNLHLEAGQIFGLVGPNGAGKTTLVKMLCTLVLPTSGSAAIHGIPLTQEGRIKRTIGLMTGNERHFYWRLTGRDNLRFYAGLHGLSPAESAVRIDALAEMLGLGPYLERRFDSYSTGMKHSLALACSLLHRPSLLFLDEPTRSLDPLAAARFRQVLQTQAREEQRTVFLVTHDLHEAIELCDSAAVMVRGKLYMTETPAHLRTLLQPQEQCRIEMRDIEARGIEAAWLSDLPLNAPTPPTLTESATPGLTTLTLTLPQGGKSRLAPLLETIEARGGSVERITFEPPSWDAIVAELQATPSPSSPAPQLPLSPAPPLPAIPPSRRYDTYGPNSTNRSFSCGAIFSWKSATASASCYKCWVSCSRPPRSTSSPSCSRRARRASWKPMMAVTSPLS